MRIQEGDFWREEGEDTLRSWTTARRETLFAHPLFSLERRRLERGGGGEGTGREEREALVLHSRDWVHVVPVVSGGASGEGAGDPRLVLVRQWRFGSESFHLELPGGIVDSGEEPRVAGERELLEETGYRAASWRPLGVVDPNPAILDNRLWVWLAEGCERVAEPTPDGGEEVETVVLGRAELREMTVRGELRHGLMLASLHLYDLARESRSRPERPGAAG